MSQVEKLLTPTDVLLSLRLQRTAPWPIPKMEPVFKKKDGWMLHEDWHYTHPGLDLDIFIPKYFFCDLDSIPRIPYIYSFFKGYARVSALVHDWFYATGLVSRDVADRIFYDLMILEGVHPIRAKLAYKAVSIFGKLFYGKRGGVYDALMAPEVRDANYH